MGHVRWAAATLCSGTLHTPSHMGTTPRGNRHTVLPNWANPLPLPSNRKVLMADPDPQFLIGGGCNAREKSNQVGAETGHRFIQTGAFRADMYVYT